jgi:hypothetical protein
LQNSVDQEITLEHLVEILKQSDPEEPEKPEPEPEPETKEATMTTAELAEGLRLIEATPSCLRRLDQRPATTKQ